MREPSFSNIIAYPFGLDSKRYTDILMNNNLNHKKEKPVSTGEVNHELLPKITRDEIDLEIDERRDEEIAGDKPPHHG